MKRNLPFQKLLVLVILISTSFTVYGQLNRSYSGVLNNVGNLWGAAYDTMRNIAPPAFGDGISLPAGDERPNPRHISNILFDQKEDINDMMGLSAYAWAFGQFIDHDITLSPNQETEVFPIQIPAGDKYFDPNNTGVMEIPMMRSDYIRTTGNGPDNPRLYYNKTTAFIDGSAVYGEVEEKALWLRSFKDGKLKTSEGNLLPYNTEDGNYNSLVDEHAPEMDMPFPHTEKWFVAGDSRANENPMLTAVHTVFMREHNRLCDELKSENPDWSDEEIFQKARKLVGGLIQSIVYEEWLPTMGMSIPEYTGYDSKVNPAITNVFATAAYRYGHTTITPILIMMDHAGNEMGSMPLRQAFFNPSAIQQYGGIEPFLIGGNFMIEQRLDSKVISELRNFLFGQPGQGGMDLVSININRGRERGLPDYNTVREAYGLDAYTSFDQITKNPMVSNMLEELYGDINLIDPWVGMLSEEKMENTIFGPTIHHIVGQQFHHIRVGDRFYYEIDEGLSVNEIKWIKESKLSDIIRRNTDIDILSDNVFIFQSDDRLLNRTIDGSKNNINHPEWGAAGAKVIIETPVEYADGIAEPSGEERPNPREISNAIFLQTTSQEDKLNLSAYNWGWGQFIDHDITLSPEMEEDVISFSIPKFDPYFDPQGTGNKVMPLKRSVFAEETGTGIGDPRMPINGITAYIDGSAVYGSDNQREAWLRTGEGGKLKTSSGNLLPYNTYSGELEDAVDPEAPMMAMPMPGRTKWFVAGDVRANENPFLASIHTLFLREHNRQCDRIASENPDWDDEQIYQHARKIIGGQIEAIVYEEWLPTIGMEVPDYQGYDDEVQPGIKNIFSTAAYRYGHTTINSELVRMDINGEIIPEGNILLRDAYFNTNAISDAGGVTPFLQGMATVVQQEFDCHVIDDLRNFLFGPPGAGGLDLVSINIFRGRERGLADYNTVRKQYGMEPITSFSELSSNPEWNQHYASIYPDVNTIDPWAGFLAEDHMPNALFGETAMYIIKKQFMDLRDGDYFYYENDPVLSPEEKSEIKQTTLAQIIKNNTDIYNIQDNVFLATQATTSIDELAELESEFTIYPNPAADVIYIQSQDPDLWQNAIVVLTDIAGHQIDMIRNVEVGHHNAVSIPLDSQMPGGVYIARVLTEKGSKNLKFIKIE